MLNLRITPFHTTVFLLLALLLSVAVTAQHRPNIVLILSDDAGYADFGFHGSTEMETPHLDQLAAESIRCTQAYVSAAVCGPSRAGILTGRYQQRFGYEENNVPGYMAESCLADDDMGLPLDQVTIADLLRSQGYRTGLIGKWHQGNADRFHPLHRGFDEFYGFRGGARSYFEFTEENPTHRREDFLERGFGQFGETEQYLTDAFVDEAISFVDRYQDSSFFLFLSLNAVHTPMEAQPSDLQRYSHLPAERQTIAAMTYAMDRAIGRFLDALDANGLRDNTIVIFTNDNGGPSDTNQSDNRPLSGTKANHLEGGIRVPFLIRWPGHFAANTTYDHPISTLDILPTAVSVADGDLPAGVDIDGVDLTSHLSGTDDRRPHETLYWKKENRAAIRDGDWKLLRYPDRPAELYHIPTDISEQNDRASEEPERVRALYQKLFAWETTLSRPRWQLKRIYEAKAMERMDAYRDGSNK